MEIDRSDGRTANQLRPLACSRNVLNRAHGSATWSQGETKVIAAVYGPKAGVKKNENPEKSCVEVIWKPKTGQVGKSEKEYEMILKRTLQSICILTVNPNTTTSIVVQVVNDDGAMIDVIFSMKFIHQVLGRAHCPIESPFSCTSTAHRTLLPCAINAACAALVDAGLPMKHLAVSICCCLAENGFVILDPSKLEEKKMKSFAYLVFPSSLLSVIPKESLIAEGEPMENGLITSVTHGLMSVDDYLHCLERGRAASAKLSDFLRRTLQPQILSDQSKAA